MTPALVLSYFIIGSVIAFRSAPMSRNALAFLWLWPLMVLAALVALVAPVWFAKTLSRWMR